VRDERLNRYAPAHCIGERTFDFALVEAKNQNLNAALGSVDSVN
jgi:hypothetical protein